MNWRKSKYSGQGGGNCVEVASSAPIIAVRDTKQEGTRRDVLAFTPEAWQRFTRKLREP